MKLSRAPLGLLIICFILACGKKSEVKPGELTGTVVINGKSYPTIIIGNQIWTSENYSGPGGNELVPLDSWYMPENYGHYYSDVNISLPPNWRVPSKADYNKLIATFSSAVDSNGNGMIDIDVTRKLMSTSGWRYPGTNSSGFNAFGATAANLNISTGEYDDGGAPGAYATFLTQDTIEVNDPTFYVTKRRYVFGINSVPVGSPVNPPDPSKPYTSNIYLLTSNVDYIYFGSLRFVMDN